MPVADYEHERKGKKTIYWQAVHNLFKNLLELVHGWYGRVNSKMEVPFTTAEINKRMTM